MDDADIVEWIAMVIRYAQNGFFFQKVLKTIKLNSINFASILVTCTIMGALE